VVRITCGLGSSVSEEYTACIFRKLLEGELVFFVRTVCITGCLVLVWRDTISILFGVENSLIPLFSILSIYRYNLWMWK